MSASRRPGGRSERVRRAVLSATAEEVLAHGLEGLSVTAIARRAQVHHTTIYRRWPDISALLLETAIEITRARMPAPDLGALRADLAAYFGALIQLLSDGRVVAVVRSLLATSEPALEELRHRYWQERFGVVETIIARAVARGELPQETEPWRLIELIAGPIWMRTLLTGLPCDAELLARAIDDALRALVAL